MLRGVGREAAHHAGGDVLGGQHIAHEDRAVVVNAARGRRARGSDACEQYESRQDVSPDALHRYPPGRCDPHTRAAHPSHQTKRTAPGFKEPKTWRRYPAPRVRRPRTASRRAASELDPGDVRFSGPVTTGQTHRVPRPLLVARDERPRRGQLRTVHARRQTERGKERCAPLDEAEWSPPERGGRAHLRHRPDGDRLAVQPAGVAAVRFDCVTHGVPQVQEGRAAPSRARRL